MAIRLNQITVGDTQVLTCDVNPITSGGLDAPQGTIATSLNGDGVYYKYGPNITDWRSVSSENYVHTQSIPSATWTVNHNLNRRVSVSVVDSTNKDIITQITWIDNNTVQVDFNGLMTGYVYCN